MNPTNTLKTRPVFRFSIRQMLILVSAFCLVSALSVQLEFTPLAGAGAMSIVVLLWIYQIVSGQTDVSVTPIRRLRWRVGWAIVIGSVGVLCGAIGFFVLGAARWWQSAQLPCFFILAFIVVAVPGFCLGFALRRRRVRPLWRDGERVAVLCHAAWTFPYAAALLVYAWLWYSSQRYISSEDGMFAIAVAAVLEWTIVTLGIADTKLWWKRRNIRRTAQHDVKSRSSSCVKETGNDVPI